MLYTLFGIVSIVLIFTVLFTISFFLKPEKAISQGGLCKIQGVKEEGTGNVYCIGVGQTTCYVPCGDGSPGCGGQSI